jgi:hypothetical protein
LVVRVWARDLTSNPDGTVDRLAQLVGERTKPARRTPALARPSSPPPAHGQESG